MNVSERLSRFVVEAGPDRVSGEVIGAAKRCFLDCVGVLLAGTAQPESRMIATKVAELLREHLKERPYNNHPDIMQDNQVNSIALKKLKRGKDHGPGIP
jgi:hypothetical protein